MVSEKFPIYKGIGQRHISSKVFFHHTTIFRPFLWDEKGIKMDGKFLSQVTFINSIVLMSQIQIKSKQ